MSTASAIAERPAFYNEAWRIVDRQDLPPSAFNSVRASLISKAYLQEIEPYVKQLVSIHAIAIPRFILGSDGQLSKLDDGLTVELRAIADGYEARIAEIQAKYTAMALA